MQARTKKLFGFLARPHIDELILLLSRDRVDEREVERHLGISQSTANRALRDLESWGLALSEVPDGPAKRGRRKRYWRLAAPEAVSFLDRADAFMRDLLQQQVLDSEALTDKARRDRVKAAASDEAAA